MAKRKRARGAKGLGTAFYSESRACWVARKPVGTRVRAGKRVTVYVERTGATQAEAVRRRDAAAPPAPSVTVAQWAERWLDSADVREQSRDAYRQSVELRIVPQLGGRRVCDVTPHEIEAAARKWGEAVGANSVRKHLSHARSLFGAATRAGLIVANPVALARKPRGERTEIEPFTPAELARIVATGAAEPRFHRLALMAALGLRIGEAIALRQSDYDAATGTLAVQRTRTIKHGVGPPKSANSRRTVRVPEAARPAAAALGPELNHKTAARRWVRLLQSAGVRTRNPHQARHTVATLAIAAGVPVANVARDLGDAVDTVVRTYLHPTPGADLCGAIDGLLRAAEGGDKVDAAERESVPRPRKARARAKK